MKSRLALVGMLNNNIGNRVGLFFSKHFDLPNYEEPFEIIVTLKS